MQIEKHKKGYKSKFILDLSKWKMLVIFGKKQYAWIEYKCTPVASLGGKGITFHLVFRTGHSKWSGSEETELTQLIDESACCRI